VGCLAATGRRLYPTFIHAKQTAGRELLANPTAKAIRLGIGCYAFSPLQSEGFRHTGPITPNLY